MIIPSPTGRFVDQNGVRVNLYGPITPLEAGVSEFIPGTSQPPVLSPADVVRETRRVSYPPMADYLDAQVKKASSDPGVVAAGEAQEATYLAACQAVKTANPFSL